MNPTGFAPGVQPVGWVPVVDGGKANGVKPVNPEGVKPDVEDVDDPDVPEGVKPEDVVPDVEDVDPVTAGLNPKADAEPNGDGLDPEAAGADEETLASVSVPQAMHTSSSFLF